jgi:N-acetylglutamate synthase/N-acetylornithine aminotransferase
MTEHKLRVLIAQAVRLDRGIQQAQAKLKDLKAQLAAEAETRQDEAIATEGGGTSITFEGAGGCIARVTQTGRALKSAIKPEDKNFTKIVAAAGAAWKLLFRPEVVHVLAENFRDEARAALGDAAAKPLIKLCETAGKTTVSFETKDQIAERRAAA